MKHSIIAGLILLFSFNVSLAQGASEASVRQLLAISGEDRLATQIIDQVLAVLKQRFVQVPDTYWQSLKQQAGTAWMTDIAVSVYASYLTEGEVQELIAFYQSPLGQKVLQIQPGINSELVNQGQAWGKQFAEQIVGELQRAGYQ